ncbi:MAG TPA: glutathione peroxidase, partial [Bacteroidia bacterium]|nr:glutathione peroxidase [Bacteroidia bacterium]
MKKTLLFVLILFAINIQAQTTETFHDFNAVTIRGDSISLSIYAGKKILVVNTASYCGFTPQYADLEALYLQYGGPNFEILGFPCNDFGGQEPGSNGSIDSFCTGTYNISFQMMSRISITAPDTAEVYKWLQNASRNGVADAPVAWNFNKFLIDEAGNWVAYYPSSVNPLDTAIVNWILSPNTTGIKNQDAQFVWTIAGNPVKDVMRLQFSNSRRMNCTFDIFDIHGRQLLMNTL